MCDEIMVWINEKDHLVRSMLKEIASNPYKFNILDKKHNDFEKVFNFFPSFKSLTEILYMSKSSRSS